MSQQPAPLPPSAVHDDTSGGIKGFFIVVTIVTIVSISLRFWSRCIRSNAGRGAGRHTQHLWWDDWAALAAVPFILGLCGLAFAMGFFGLGHHTQFVEPKDLSIFLRLLYAIYFVYDIGLFFTKLSALLFLSRIFPWHANSKWFNYTIVATHCLNCAWLAGIIFGTVFMCNPVEKGWNPTLPGHCGTTSALWLGSAIPSVIIDLIILLLPLPKIWTLQMTTTRKMAIIGVFVIGYSVIVVSIGRLITVLLTGSTLDSDITYSVVHLAYWVGAEAPITMLCICLPPMTALGRYLANNYFSKMSSRVHSLFSTIKGSKGTAASRSYSAPDSQSQSIAMHSSTMKKSVDNDGRSLESQESSAQLFPHKDEHYYAGARADVSYFHSGIHGTTPPPDSGDAAIRVDSVVTVTQRLRK
ncbi:Major Facilitator Superfamily protein [Aspergillus affinis]|uniref:Major Facilitator Superfamily protein n=1 Tax=Aspergillus affinis TaxID=1070780 RepID=UPI0022FE405F|nr:Major Facilitator Superfamily protein [Aspergillus affinis]KAI9035838.1 Major Facilitator Superfamily protein [Aspergillus affinis]